MQLLDAILNELKVAAYGELKIAAYGERQSQMSSEGFNETDHSDFWTEMTNLQKAKIIR